MRTHVQQYENTYIVAYGDVCGHLSVHELRMHAVQLRVLCSHTLRPIWSSIAYEHTYLVV